MAELLAPSAPQPDTGAAVRQALAQRLPAGATDLELLLQHAEAGRSFPGPGPGPAAETPKLRQPSHGKALLDFAGKG